MDWIFDAGWLIPPTHPFSSATRSPTQAGAHGFVTNYLTSLRKSGHQSLRETPFSSLDMKNRKPSFSGPKLFFMLFLSPPFSSFPPEGASGLLSLRTPSRRFTVTSIHLLSGLMPSFPKKLPHSQGEARASLKCPERAPPHPSTTWLLGRRGHLRVTCCVDRTGFIVKKLKLRTSSKEMRP